MVSLQGINPFAADANHRQEREYQSSSGHSGPHSVSDYDKQETPDSPPVILVWHASKYKVHDT